MLNTSVFNHLKHLVLVCAATAAIAAPGEVTVFNHSQETWRLRVIGGNGSQSHHGHDLTVVAISSSHPDVRSELTLDGEPYAIPAGERAVLSLKEAPAANGQSSTFNVHFVLLDKNHNGWGGFVFSTWFQPARRAGEFINTITQALDWERPTPSTNSHGYGAPRAGFDRIGDISEGSFTLELTANQYHRAQQR